MGFRGEQLRYLIVGFITTAINTGTFWIAQQSLGVSVQNMLAWVVGVSLTSLVTPVKVGSNLVVVILNYLLSKYIVWKQGDNKIGQR